MTDGVSRGTVELGTRGSFREYPTVCKVTLYQEFPAHPTGYCVNSHHHAYYVGTFLLILKMLTKQM